MRIAVLSDIHGNSTALRAVLVDIQRSDIDEVLFLGDFVGYYYDVVGVLDLLYEACSTWVETSISGNHEDLLRKAANSADVRASYLSTYGSALDIALETLSDSDFQRLTTLPKSRDLDRSGKRLSLHHGTPADPDAYLYPDAPLDKLQSCEIEGADWVLMGHTHYPFQYCGAVSNLLNPGSVGQSRTHGGAASWAILDLDTNTTELRTSRFAIDALQADVRARDPHRPYLASVLERGKRPLNKDT